MGSVMTEAAGRLSRDEERTLVLRAQAGDHQALSELLRLFEPVIYRFGMRLCGNAEDAQDVLQETLLSAARNLSSFRGDARFSTWLYMIARNFCLKRERARRSETVPIDERVDLPAQDPAPEASAGDRELLAALDRALSTLDPDNRAVLVLRDVEGQSAQETADALEMSVPQVKSRLHRARAMVRAALLPILEQADPASGQLRHGCPDLLEDFSRFLEDDISQTMCEAMQSHIDTCASCRTTSESLKRTLWVCNHAPAPKVPRDVVVALRHAIRRHLQACDTTANSDSTPGC